MYSPVPGARISSRYRGGFRSTGGHSGIDFAAPSGSAIRAVVPGTVIGSSYAGRYGNLVRVRHTDGSIGYYAHMSKMSVRTGTKVQRGSILGKVGSTGNSTGPHAHFEVRRNGRPVNPLPWLDKNYRATSSGGGGGMSGPGSYGGTQLSSEQLRNAATILRVGKSLGASNRDLTIALMTAYQESNLRNLDYGDRDSIGMFQQRNAWGSRSARLNPVQSTRMFFLGGNAGQPGLFDKKNRNSMSLTQAAQAVQVSAFPNAYARWESMARSILGGDVSGRYGDSYSESTTTGFRDANEVLGELAFDEGPMPASFGLGSPEDPLTTAGVTPAEPPGPFVLRPSESDLGRGVLGG